MDETTNTTATSATVSSGKIRGYARLIFIGIFAAIGLAILARIISVATFYAVIFVEIVATCVMLEALLRAIDGPSKIKDLLKKIMAITWMIPIFIFFISLVIHMTGGSMLDFMVTMEKVGWKRWLFDGSTTQMEINLIVGLIGIWLSWRLSWGMFINKKMGKVLPSSVFALLVVLIFAREYIPIVPALERYSQATMTASADTIDVAAMSVEANMNPRVYIAITEIKEGDAVLFNKGDRMALVNTKVKKKGQESTVEVVREIDGRFEEPAQSHFVQWRLIKPYAPEPEVAKKETSTPAQTTTPATARIPSMVSTEQATILFPGLHSLWNQPVGILSEKYHIPQGKTCKFNYDAKNPWVEVHYENGQVVKFYEGGGIPKFSTMDFRILKIKQAPIVLEII